LFRIVVKSEHTACTAQQSRMSGLDKSDDP
jgi:hypothetical protein